MINCPLRNGTNEGIGIEITGIQIGKSICHIYGSQLIEREVKVLKASELIQRKALKASKLPQGWRNSFTQLIAKEFKVLKVSELTQRRGNGSAQMIVGEIKEQQM